MELLKAYVDGQFKHEGFEFQIKAQGTKIMVFRDMVFNEDGDSVNFDPIHLNMVWNLGYNIHLLNLETEPVPESYVRMSKGWARLHEEILEHVAYPRWDGVGEIPDCCSIVLKTNDIQHPHVKEAFVPVAEEILDKPPVWRKDPTPMQISERIFHPNEYIIELINQELSHWKQTRM